MRVDPEFDEVDVYNPNPGADDNECDGDCGADDAWRAMALRAAQVIEDKNPLHDGGESQKECNAVTEGCLR